MANRSVHITPDRGVELGLGERLGTTWTLLRSWVRRELRARYRQSALRASWSIIQPLTILLTYGWVLTRVLDIGSENVPYLTFAWAGLVPYTFLQQSLGQGVGSLQQAGSLIGRVYFPREVVPLSVVGCNLVDLLVTTSLLIVVSWVQVGPPTIHLLALPLVVVVLLTWAVGPTLLVASLNVFSRDLSHAMPLVLRVLFIVSPVMYPAAMLAGSARINPLAAIIEATRDVTFRGRWPDWSVLGPHLGAGVIVVVVGYVVTRRLEPRMGDYV